MQKKMEKFIQIVTQHNHQSDTESTKIKIDNSTDFRDFIVKVVEGDKLKQEFYAQLSSEDTKTGKKSLEINGVNLYGREIELFKEFINQEF